MERSKIVDILIAPKLGNDVNIKGWVRTKRGSKGLSFVAINDVPELRFVHDTDDLVACLVDGNHDDAVRCFVINNHFFLCFGYGRNETDAAQ